MDSSELSSAADFAHLDGALVFPMFIDEYHILVVEDGSILALPAGMHVHLAGRIAIDSEGVPYVGVQLSSEDARRLVVWGEALSEPGQIEGLRAALVALMEQFPNPEKYINQPPCIATGGEEDI